MRQVLEDRMMFRRLVVLLLLLIAIPTLGAAIGPQWKSKMEAAQKAVKELRLAAAQDLYAAALKDAETLGQGNPLEGVTRVAFGKLRRLQGCYADAEALLTRALPIVEKAYGQDVGFAAAAGEMGVIKDFLGLSSAAEQWYKRSLSVFRAKSARIDPPIAEILARLQDLYEDGGRYAEALQLAEFWGATFSKLEESNPTLSADYLLDSGSCTSRRSDTRTEYERWRGPCRCAKGRSGRGIR